MTTTEADINIGLPVRKAQNKKTRDLRMSASQNAYAKLEAWKRFFRSSFVNYPADKLFLQIGQAHKDTLRAQQEKYDKEMIMKRTAEHY